MITYYFRTIRDKETKKLSDYRRGAIEVISHAVEEDIKHVAESVNLEVADLVDIFDIQEIPRMEIEDDVVLLFVRAPLPLEDKQLIETQLYMIVYKKKQLYVITNGSADLFTETLDRSKTATTQPAKLLLQFLLKLSKKYTQYINEVARRVDEKRRIMAYATDGDIAQLVNYEAILNEYVSVLSPMRRICEALVHRPQMGWYEDDKDLIEDLLNSLGQSQDVCIVNLKKIQSIRDSFQIVFTNRLNQTVKLLTSVTILLTIPTLIASIFGMNVELPISHPQAFWMVMLISLCFIVLVVILFRRMKWL